MKPGGGSGGGGGGGGGGEGGNLPEAKSLPERGAAKPPAEGGSDGGMPGTHEALKESLEAMRDVAARLREKKLDPATLERAREAHEGLTGFGRGFNAEDREHLEATAERMRNDPRDGEPLPKPPAGPPTAKLPEGRVQERFDGNAMRAVENKPGEMAEDPLRRTIEAGQAKVVPEYRKPLEEYYKAVSK